MSLKRRLEDCVPQTNPLLAPDFIEADIQALRAVAGGYAEEDQQKRAIIFIVNNICGTYDCAFRPGGSDRETNLALGKQRAGQILVHLLQNAETKTPAEKIQARILGRSKT